MWARSDIKRPRIKTGHIVHSAVGFGVSVKSSRSTWRRGYIQGYTVSAR